MIRTRFILALALVLAFALASATADVVCNADEWQALILTNKYRAANGVAPLSLTSKMQQAAFIRADEVGVLFDYDHTRPDGRKFSTVFGDLGMGYRRVRENTAIDYFDAYDVMEGWKDSPDHNETLLMADFHHIGIGKANEQWAQLFLVRNCGAGKLSVSLPSPARLDPGSDIEELDAIVGYKCPDSQHGQCIIPLISEMCTGFDPNTIGAQNVTVALRGQKTTITVYVGVDPPEPKPAPPAPVRSIKITGQKRVMSGQSVQLKAEIKPAKAAPAPLNWTSSNPEALIVDENGLASAREGIEAALKVSVTASSVDNPSVSASRNITAYPATRQIQILHKAIPIEEITVQKKANSVKLKARATPDDASQSFKWSSSDAQIADVNKKGKVTLKKKGEVVVTAAATDGTGVEASVRVVIE